MLLKLGTKNGLLSKLGTKSIGVEIRDKKWLAVEIRDKKWLGVEIKDIFFSSILDVFLSSYFTHYKQTRFIMNLSTMIDLDMLYKIAPMTFARFLIKRREKFVCSQKIVFCLNFV